MIVSSLSLNFNRCAACVQSYMNIATSAERGAPANKFSIMLKGNPITNIHTYIHALFHIAGWIKGSSQRLMWTCCLG